MTRGTIIGRNRGTEIAKKALIQEIGGQKTGSARETGKGTGREKENGRETVTETGIVAEISTAGIAEMTGTGITAAGAATGATAEKSVTGRGKGADLVTVIDHQRDINPECNVVKV